MFSSLGRRTRRAGVVTGWFAALLLAPVAGLSALALSERLPEFTYPDVAGEPRSSADWAGRSLIVNFWATWCAPCRAEIPELVEAAPELEARGFTIIGIAMDEQAAVQKFLDEVPVNYPVLIVGDADLALPQQFSTGIYGLPATVFTADDGRLVWGRAAALHGDEVRAVAEQVARVNAGEITIEQARAEIDAAMAELAAARLLQE